jgi:hypothetical protein
MLAEMAARADLPEAETHFCDALAIEPDDFYLLGAYADYLLDRDRPAEVETLLTGRENADPLLLRLALAARSQNAPSLAARIAQLRDRFEASRMRGDAVHSREEARFALSVLGDPKAALRLATENWRAQKEAADIRILAESAVAANDADTLAVAREWLSATRLEDSRMEKILAAATHPD